MAVYDEYAYVVNETSGGIQVFDLSLIDSGTVSILSTPGQFGPAKSHNVTINPDSGYLYLSGSSADGLQVYDLNGDPANPSFAGSSPVSYIHDLVVHSYTSGPYAGKEIVFAFSASSGVQIIDVTDKGNMVLLSTTSYPNTTYTHHGALSEDLQYLFVNDELDEQDNANVSTTTTYVLDVQDLSAPSYVTSFTNGLAAIDHNPMVRGNYLYEANYTSGLRIYDVSDINNVTEVGYYDTYPADNNTAFNGAWGVDASLPSGTVIVSDIQSGLFVLDPSRAQGTNGSYRVELTDLQTLTNVRFGVGAATNNAPTISPVGEQFNTNGDVVNLQLSATDINPGDSLTFSATGLPAGLTIDASTGVISGTIATGAEVGSPYAVIVTVTDDGDPNKSAQALFSWNVNSIAQNQPLYRINAGGSPLASIDSGPVNWSGDTSSSPSSYVNSSQTNNTYSYSVSNPITAGPSVPSSVPLALFQTERFDTSWSSPEMQWNFPVSNGSYEVRLYFAENYSGAGSPGKRVFDVVIEDILTLDNYDVVADAGAMFVGVMQSFEVEVTDELLTIDLLHVIENPAIKGIEIIDLTLQAAAASSPQLVEQGLPDDSPSGTTQFSNYVMQIFATDSYDLEIQYNSSQAETVSWELLNTGETGSFVTSGSGASELQYIYGLTIPEGLQMLQLSYADGFSLEYIDALLSEPSSFSGYLSDTDAVTGNFQLLANVQELVSSGARPEVGIIIEEPSSGASRFVQLGIQLDLNYYARVSTEVNGSVEELNTGLSGSFPNAWILLERTGDQISMAVSSDNVSYQLIQVITLPSLPDTLDAGLYIDSGSENIDAKATLQNFETIPLP